MDSDTDPFFIEISVSYFSKETQEFCLPKWDDNCFWASLFMRKLYIYFMSSTLSNLFEPAVLGKILHIFAFQRVHYKYHHYLLQISLFYGLLLLFFFNIIILEINFFSNFLKSFNSPVIGCKLILLNTTWHGISFLERCFMACIMYIRFFIKWSQYNSAVRTWHFACSNSLTLRLWRYQWHTV